MMDREKLRVLLVGPVPRELGSGNPGGVARSLWTQARQLRGRGHGVTVLALGRYFRRDRRVEGVDIVGLRLRPSALLWSAVRWIASQPGPGTGWTVRDRLYLLYTLYRMATVEDLQEYDVIHVHGPYTAGPVAARALGASQPVLVTVHSYTLILDRPAGAGREGRVALHSDVFRAADAVAHVSRTDRERGRELGVEWSGPDFVIHNAVDGRATERPRGPGAREGVCFVGSLILRKGIQDLLSVWSDDPPGGARLSVAGSGELRDEVEVAARGNPDVDYLGYLDPGEVREVLGRSMCLAVPSYSESFGLVYLEALVEGTPVVGYHRSLREIASALDCSERESGYLHPLDAPAEGRPGLRRAIEGALSARRADRTGEVARGLSEKVQRRFGGERMASELETVYRKIQARRGTNSGAAGSAGARDRPEGSPG